MPPLLDVLTLGRCSHEFSWPRRADDGNYYQVCLLCAAEYKYDWKTMRRVERMEIPLAEAVRQPRRRHTQKPTWVPRARRLKLGSPVRYRAKTLAAWYPGVIDNLSQSGVLFRGPQGLPRNTIVEMRFQMPEEISGQKESMVFCQAEITRCKEKQAEKEDVVLAAAILDYQFVHEH